MALMALQSFDLRQQPNFDGTAVGTVMALVALL